MNAAWVTLGSLGMLFAGYRFYGRFIERRVYHADRDDLPMPSQELEDGVDFVPTSKHTLFGHHFSSIAGAAPILGPAIAVVWGWLPALLWVVLGSIFMGAVHDYGALVISARHKGRSIGSIAQDVIGPRAKRLLLLIIFLLVFIAIAVFAFVIATLFMNYPGSVIPINFEIIVAVLIGWWSHRNKGSLLIPSLVALVLLYVMTYVGFLYPIHLPEWLFIGGSEIMTWIVLLLLYGFIASVLPVWALLQPRDLINSHQLIVALVIIYAGIFVSSPEMDAPALNFSGSSLPWFPFLFITIACGAISGFHSLVSSGTTSKQLKSITHARPIGYGSMIGEASLAVASTIAVAAGFADSGAWHAHYDNAAVAGSLAGQLQAFVNGTAGFITALYPGQESESLHTLAAVFISVVVISFAATSLDTAVRIQRYVLGEIGQTLKIDSLARNRYLQAGLAVTLSLLLVLSDGGGKGGLRLWPLFGSTNQLLGSLALLVISVWLYRKKWPYQYTLIPMVLITLITFIASTWNIQNYLLDGSWMLASIAIVIVVAQLWIIFEAVQLVRRRPDLDPAP